MNVGFYRTFEDRLRGSRELIKKRLQVYLPFILPLCEQYPDAPALDLGCGRGEWLEVLTTAGFSPTGVDLDEGMLSACYDLGLSVCKGEAVAHLASLPDNSQAVISAFHVVEHIGFTQLRALVSDALRVLKPGGLLIMETPNPENIIVATRNFYFDPTHQRPIPAELLSFVPEYYGFKRVKIIRLQESKELVQCETPSLQDVFQGASPDYAVVAQKEADADVLAATTTVFDGEYGLTLETLSARYDHATQLKIQQAETIAQQAETKAQQAETKAQQAETIAQQAETIAQQAETIAQQAEQASLHWQQQAHQWHERILALHSSTSWKITKPFRAIKRLLTGDFAAINQSIVAVKLKVKQTFRPMLSSSINYVFKQPTLSNALNSLLKCFPRLHQRLRRVAENTGVLKGMDEDPVPIPCNSVQSELQPDLSTMPPRARQIYNDLKAAIEKKNKEDA